VQLREIGGTYYRLPPGIREILQARRLGHQVPGMQGIYTHVTPAMREHL
jgi:hypothetical protein